MFRKKRNVGIFISIILLGVLLRFYQLGNFPAGFHRDEAFLGYNAYSILKTGRDMSGALLPLHFKSFIYSPGGYSYFSIPFIFLFGLSAFSVRFASAFFGSLTVIISFFLVQELFVKYKFRNLLSLATVFFLAISPWNINLSRTATENTLVVFFVALGVFLFLRATRNRSFLLLLLSFLSFGITLTLYQAPRAFLPLFLPLLCFLFCRAAKKRFIFMFTLLYVLCIIIPLITILLSPNLSLRIRTVSLFASENTQLTLNQAIREDGVSDVLPIESRIFHNKFLGYGAEFLDNYFKHFSYDFLFTDQALPDRYRIPGVGLLYTFELPLVLFGLYFLLRNEKKVGIFLVGWVLLAPIGSALAFDDIPNLQRSLIVFPALSVVSAYGLSTVYQLIKPNRLIKISGLVCLMVVALFSFIFYLHEYYVHDPLYRPWYRNDGYKNLVSKVNQLLPSYKKAVITNRESAPAIFFLFYSKYDPGIFQKETMVSHTQDYDRINFARYEFSQEQCPLTERSVNGKKILNGEKGVLYVDSALCNIPKDAKLFFTIKRSDSSRVFYGLSR